MKRVVITGIGAVSPLGGDASLSWKNLINNKSGIKTIEGWNIDSLPVTIAGQVPYGKSEKGFFNPDEWVEEKDRKKIEKFILYAISAASQAICDSGIILTEKIKSNAGISIGSGIGGLNKIYENSINLHRYGFKRINPFFVPGSLINLASGQVAIKFGIMGPNHATATACSAGANAIGDAFNIISSGLSDIMIAGGAESAICPLGIAGFHKLKALSKNSTPELASRPWDKKRDGFIMGEGSGIVILEELDHAIKRNARIYAEMLGYGMSGDAYHITSPPEDGYGAYKAMINAMSHARISAKNVDYINAHGTSTILGDLAEIKAIKNIFNNINDVSVSSTKSSTGHLLGGSGGLEAVFSVLSIHTNFVPPTLNIKDPIDECIDVDMVPNKSRNKKVSVVLSNSFGFGGTNISLIFKKFKCDQHINI
jgi:3-oxoacyl-[acyl-carrier-protein] synthase II